MQEHLDAVREIEASSAFALQKQLRPEQTELYVMWNGEGQIGNGPLLFLPRFTERLKVRQGRNISVEKLPEKFEKKSIVSCYG